MATDRWDDLKRVVQDLQRDFDWLEKQDGADPIGIARVSARMSRSLVELEELRDLKAEMPPEVAEAYEGLSIHAMAAIRRSTAYLCSVFRALRKAEGYDD